MSRQIEKTFHVHFLKLQIYKFIHHFQQVYDASVIDDEKWFVVRNREVNFGGFHKLGKHSIQILEPPHVGKFPRASYV